MCKRILLLFAILRMPLMAQEDMTDRITVELSNPGAPCFVELNQINGGITVNTHDQDHVLVESTVRMKSYSDKNALSVFVKSQNKNKNKHTVVIPETESSEKKKKKDREGLTRIPVHSNSIEVEEEENRIEIDTESWKNTTDVTLYVPENTSLDVSCVNHGDISVNGVSGQLEVNNINGKVTLKDVSGSVVAHALNKDLTVNLKQIDPDEPMSFTTMNGDIDVTLPADSKFNVKIKNNNGEVYSDFNIKKIDKPTQITEKNNRDEGGKYRVRIENAFYGSVNGGGPEYTFESFNGDVVVRKGSP